MTPDSAQKKFQKVHDLVENGFHQEAARICNEILDHYDHPLVANVLGFCLKELGKDDYAARVWDQVVASHPDCVPAIANLANLCRERMRYDRAKELLHHAFALNPDHHRVLHNLAVLYVDLGEYDRAKDYALQALNTEPDSDFTKHTLALSMLACGNTEGGLQLYESRKKIFQRDAAPIPAYEGGSAKVIVRHEQGYGDTLMVCRWLPKLREMGAEVYITAPAPLHRLLVSSGLCQLHDDEDHPEYTHHLWTMDMLRMFMDDWRGVDGQPYIRADLECRAQWREKLGGKKEGLPRIGLCWSGAARPDNHGAYIIDRRRSMSQSEAAQIVSSLPEACWVNLVREWGLPGTVDFGTSVKDFEDQAAIISELDLVIAVDTAVAHLAGALGKPVWMLSRYDACWRWWPYSERTPWYDSMRCFYQHKFMDWSGVIERVKNELHEHF